jgi:predicted ATPase/DNA-binding winged helix-turn-helix (wHTH) protein
MPRTNFEVVAAEGQETRASDVVSFGPFSLNPAERLLLKGNEPVQVSGRALDILMALIERAGEVINKRELIKRAWPDVTVEEAALRVQVAGLRKSLGDGRGGVRYIVNVRGRGYCFVAPIQRPAAQEVPTASPAKLPVHLAGMVGRDETVAALSSLLMSRRFVSIVGPGGVGKTTVAVAVAHALLTDFSDAVYFVDLSPLADGALVAPAVASAVGCFVQAKDPVSDLLAFLADRRILLVLDSCEHVIEAVAALSERLFNTAPQVHLLTTAREALRVEGENVHLLLPLDTPHDEIEMTAVQALASPAVQHFMERAAASGYRFELSDAEAPIVAEICRKLDGIPLAIEFAAGRVGAYGIRGVADLLDSRFKVLWHGRRSAPPRHQTLQALLDWSYNLLSTYEQMILRRLSIFAGIFTFEGAILVAGDTGADEPNVADVVASLVDKSLITVSELEGSAGYRLLDTTRGYAAAKLAECGEQDTVAKRHAFYYAKHFKWNALRAMATGGDVAAYSPHLGNVRAALEWSFSGVGDVAIGVELAARSGAMFLGLSLFGECQRWCERGLTALQEADRGTERELLLLEALAVSSMYTRGNSDEVRAALQRGLNQADVLGNRQYQLSLLAWLNIFLVRIGDVRTALAVAERSAVVAREDGEITGIVMTEWMLGVAHHLGGDQAAAQRHCELGFELAEKSGRIHVDHFGYDHRVRALVAQARILWLRGLPERAVTVARQAIEAGARRNHPITICISLIYTIPVFIWAGDFECAEVYIERLIVHAARYSLAPYHAVGLALKGDLMVARGEAAAGVQLLRRALEKLRAERHHILTTVFCRALAEGLARCGQFDEAIAAINAALELGGQGGGTFDCPDLLRAKGEILLAMPVPNVAAAEKALVRSLELARQQAALAWELRSAILLARIWADHGHADRVRDMLADILRRLTERSETADVMTARQLVAELNRRSLGTRSVPRP